MAQAPLTLILEFARAEQADDPFGFRSGPQTYLLRTAGGGYEQASFPWDEALLADLDAVRRADGDPEVPVRLGDRLRRFVSPLGWPDLAVQVSHATEQGRRVLLTIRSAAAELYALPWELLTLRASGEPIGALPNVLVRYEWPETETKPEKPVPRAGVGRILFAWSAAGGAVPAAEQIDAVAEACQAGFHLLDPTRDVLPHASLRRLGDALTAAKRDGQPISVLHILCHGGATHRAFGLLLNADADGDPAVTVDAARLQHVLGPHADMLRLVVLSACDSGNSGRLGSQLGSIAQALHRAGLATVLASRYPLSVDGSIRFSRRLYTALLEQPASLESAVLQARADLTASSEHRDWASIQLYAREADGPDTRPLQFRPYPGLAAFDRDQRRFYFGREDLTRKLWQRCQDLVADAQATRLLAILAPSGFGKSSVARAGLLVEIERRPLSFAHSQDGSHPAHIATLKPGLHPVAALQFALPPDAGNAGNAGDTGNAAATPRVVLVDQFEEVYTLCTDAAERDSFVERLLTEARAPDRPTLFVLTLRTDFLGEVGRQHPTLYQWFDAQSQLFAPMRVEDLRRTITEPAACLGRPLDDATVDLLLTQVQGNEGALPLLSFALSQIWEGLLAGRAPADTLRQIGGVGGALAGKAHEIYGALRESEKATARRALVRLVRLGEGTRDTRRRMPVRALCGRGQTEDDVLSVLRRFASEKARLVTLLSEGGETHADLTHEALLDHWSELRTWIGESRKDRALHDLASDAANRWSSAGRPPGLLWRTPDLEQLAEYQRRKPDELDQRLAGFLTCSLRQQRQERRLRIGTVVSLFAALAISAGIYIVDQRRVAAIERRRLEGVKEAAEKNRQQLLDTYIERGRQLVFERSQPSEGLLWLHRARVEGSTDAALPSLLDGALHAAGTPIAALRGHRLSVTSATHSPDGRRIVTTSEDNTARVWDAISGRAIAALTGHTGRVSSARYSPDGRRIVTASIDQTARVWDADNGRSIVELKGHTGSVECAMYSSDGRQILTASVDQTARVWDANSGRLIVELKGHAGRIHSAMYSPDGRRIVTASADHTARVWEADSGRLVTELTGHGNTVYHATFSPDGHRIVTASFDYTARVWDAESGRSLGELKGHVAGVNSAAYSPDGRRIVTASWDRTARVWDAENGRLLAELKGHGQSVNSATYSPDGRRIVTASWDRTARVWDAESGRVLAALTGHQEIVVSATFSPDGRSIVTASVDHTARVWKADRGRVIADLKGHADLVLSAAYSPDGRRIVTASWDHTARVWDADSGRLIADLKGHGDSVVSATFSPDGRRIVTASMDSTARVWDADSGRLILELKGHGDSVFGATYSPNGRRILTVSADKTARAWDSENGRLIVELKGAGDSILSATYSPDGHRIVTANSDDTARVWDADSGRLILELKGHGRSIQSATYSPDGHRILTVSGDKMARVWDANSGQRTAELKGHGDNILIAMFSPDGHHIVTASSDRTARAWNVDSGRLVAELKGHDNIVRNAGYSPDGRYIVTASGDHTARVWEANSGRLLAELAGHGNGVVSATYSPDGRRIVTTSEDRTARVWDVSMDSRTLEQLALFIRCQLPVRFDANNKHVLIPNMPTQQDCPDGDYAR